MRRLGLGLLLIAMASAVLLVSDWKQRRAPGRVPRIAIVQHASQGVLDEGVRGMVDELADRGYADGRGAELRRYNAEGDLVTANAIAREVVGGRFDLLMSATTLSLQTVGNANKSGKVKHVFGLVADPTVAGVGITATGHPAHLTGLATLPPVRESFEMARKLFPGLRSVGVASNPAEPNSVAGVARGRIAAKDLGLELIETSVEGTAGIAEATNALVSRGAQAIWVGGDVSVLVGIDSVVASARRGRVPVFTSIPGNAKRGVLFEVGANYYEVGRQTGALAADVLKGADPARIAIKNIQPGKLILNKLALSGLKDPWRITDELAQNADTVLDETGSHDKTAAVTRLSRRWKVDFVALNNVLDVEEAEEGVLAGFAEAKLVKGRDFEVTVRNAQGDMPTLNGLVDASISSGADLLVTFSTPTLQAAMQRSQGRVPIVFTYVSNAIIAGAGKSETDHLPNVTGTQMIAAHDEMLAIVREVLPRAHRIGTLFVPSEINMVYNKDQLVRAAASRGFEVETVGVATASEVSDATLALLGRNVDALVQIPGNLTASAFGGIAQAAQRKKIPVFAFQKVQAKEGAPVVLARDYVDAGRESGLMAARVMRGESPARIPFKSVTKTQLVLNPKAARAIGLVLPKALLDRAAQVLED